MEKDSIHGAQVHARTLKYFAPSSKSANTRCERMSAFATYANTSLFQTYTTIAWTATIWQKPCVGKNKKIVHIQNQEGDDSNFHSEPESKAEIMAENRNNNVSNIANDMIQTPDQIQMR